VTSSKVPVIQMYLNYQPALRSKDIQLHVMEMDQLPKFEQRDFSNARHNQRFRRFLFRVLFVTHNILDAFMINCPKF